MRNRTEKNPFAGCTVVATGKLENFTRDSINSRITSLGQQREVRLPVRQTI